MKNNYESIPHAVKAIQWHKEGDHKEVLPANIALVKYSCGKCNNLLNNSPHGIIYTLNRGNVYVCPGDYIIENDYGHEVMSEKEFSDKYRPIK